jgi:alkylation response protein AidB-like acyl-CoA dehydrogenase
MDFEWKPETEAFRAEVQRFLDAHLPHEVEDELYRHGLTHDAGFAKALGEQHWIAADWEREGFEVLGHEAIVGNEWLNTEVVPKVVRGEVAIALGMSEPEAGSDVATVQTKARPAVGPSGEAGWIIDGQKMFTPSSCPSAPTGSRRRPCSPSPASAPTSRTTTTSSSTTATGSASRGPGGAR